MGAGSYDGRKESAVRGQSVGVGGGGGEGEATLDIPILISPEERIGEGDAGNVNNNEEVSGDPDKTVV